MNRHETGVVKAICGASRTCSRPPLFCSMFPECSLESSERPPGGRQVDVPGRASRYCDDLPTVRGVLALGAEPLRPFFGVAEGELEVDMVVDLELWCEPVSVW